MMNIQRLNEVIGTNLIFTQMMTDHNDLPWSEDEDISATLLDFEYINNYSGRKVISPAVENVLENGSIPSEDFAKLCDVAYMMFNKKWTRNWTIYNIEYNPIENYSMTEHSVLTRDNAETHSGTDQFKQTGTDTHAESGTNTLLMTGTDTNVLSGTDQLQHGETHTLSGTDSLTHGEKHTLSGTDSLTHGEKHTLGGSDSTTDTRASEHEVSAFNSSGYQDSSKDTNSGGTGTQYGKTDTASGTDSTLYGKTDTASGTDSTLYGKTDTASGTDRTTYGKQDQETRNMTDATTFGHTDTETLNRTDQTIHGHKIENDDEETTDHTRSGNIGVTTSQQMAESDIQLWRWNFFYEVFADIDKIFTISTY